MTNLELFHRTINIVFTFIALLAGFFSRLVFVFLGRRVRWQLPDSISNSHRPMAIAAIGIGTIVGSSVFLAEIAFFSHGSNTFRDFASEALVLAALVASGYFVGYFVANKLLRRAK